MSRYLSGIQAISGARQAAARVGDVMVGTEQAFAQRPSSIGAFLREVRDSDPPAVPFSVGTVAGGAAGETRLPITGDFDEVTCRRCKIAYPKQYSWALGKSRKHRR